MSSIESASAPFSRFVMAILVALALAHPASAQTYAQWCAAHGLPTDASGSGALAADPALDGIPNLLKFALGLDPLHQGYSDRFLTGTAPIAGQDYLTATYTRPDPAPAGIAYSVELSSDLTAWSANGTEAGAPPSGGLQTVTVRDTQPLGGAWPRRFVRLRVAVTAAVPANTAAPRITGILAVGQTLSAVVGTWTGGTDTPAYSYQWTRDGAEISGATSATYQVSEGDAGAAIAVRVTGRNIAGSSSTTAVLPVVVPAPPGLTFFASDPSFSHLIGRHDNGGWSANTIQDSASYLVYGPYTRTIPAGACVASFKLMIDNNTADNTPVATIDVFDATAGAPLAQRTITRSEFLAPMTYNTFDLGFSVAQADHQIEFRTYWHGNSYLRELSVDVVPVAPAIVNTLNATDDIVIADYVATAPPYRADPAGVKDSTTAIQTALQDCFNAGGGTVYLPAGTYRVTNTISIPSFVTLRGDWRDPDSGSGSYGTVIRAEVASGDSGPVLFQIGGSAGAMGLTTYYPNQSAATPVAYNYTFSIPSSGWSGMPGTYMSSSVINCTMLNSYRGIGIDALDNTKVHETSTVKNVKGTVLYRGAVAYNGADVGTWENVTFNNSYWANAGAAYNAPGLASLNTWTRANGVAFTFGDLEWEQFYKLSCSDYLYGINIVAGARQKFSGQFLYTTVQNTDIAVKVDTIDTRWGTSFLRSVLNGSSYSIQNNTTGYVKVCDSTVTGSKGGSGILRMTTTTPGTSPTGYNETVSPKVTRAVLYDVTKAPYNAPRSLPQTGLPAADSTSAIQSALNAAGGDGGGVVYLPAGWYRINSHLTVPANVEMRGSSSVPTRDQSDLSLGTVLLGYEGAGTSNPDTDTALVTLNGNKAGIRGVRFFYPNNNPAVGINSYPYTIRGNGANLYAVNIGLAGVYKGIDFVSNRCDNHYIRKIVGVAYRQFISVGGGSTQGWVEGCLSNPNAANRNNFGVPGWMSESNLFAQLIDPVTRPNEILLLLNNASNENVLNIFAYGALLGVNTANCDVNVFNLGTDNQGTGGYTGGGLNTTIKLLNVMKYNGSYTSHSGTGIITTYNPMTL